MPGRVTDTSAEGYLERRSGHRNAAMANHQILEASLAPGAHHEDAGPRARHPSRPIDRRGIIMT